MAETKMVSSLNPRAPEFFFPAASHQKPKLIHHPKPEFTPAPFHRKSHFPHPLPGFPPAFFPYPFHSYHPPPPPPPQPFPSCYFHRTFEFQPPMKPNKAFLHRNVKPRKPRPDDVLFRWRNLPPRLVKQKVWLPKNRSSSADLVPPPPEEDNILAGKTSLMVRNIPNHFGREDLLWILDSHCRKENKKARKQNRASYDFLYLPMDFAHRANLGYAFVNFTSSVAAERFRREFHNYFWTNPGNKKTCEVTVAKYQGKDELSQHFKDSKFPCHTDDYLPVLLSPPSDGFRSYKITNLGSRVGLRGGRG